MNDMIDIYVGGVLFHLRCEFVCKIPYFNNDLFSINTLTEKVIHLDRSSVAFQHVIGFVNDPPMYPYPVIFEKELGFYGVEYNISQLHDPSKEIHEKIDSMERHLTILFSGIRSLMEISYDKKTGRCYTECLKDGCITPPFRKHCFCDKHLTSCCFEDCKTQVKDRKYCEKHIQDANIGCCMIRECAFTRVGDISKGCGLHAKWMK